MLTAGVAGVPGKPRIKARFARVAPRYDEHDLVQREVAARALERLDYVTLAPRHILDLGSGTGGAARALARRYRQALVVQCDLARPMLLAARRAAPRWFSRQRYVCADAEQLPFAAGRFELVFSNQLLPWCAGPAATFAGVRHVLAGGGLFLFTTLGPDTLRELRAACAHGAPRPPLQGCIDMHDIGDMLGAAGFADPVMETEYLTVEYADAMTLLRDLRGIGFGNAPGDRGRGLRGKRSLAALVEAYEAYRRDGVLPATYEVVFGHAWAAAGTPRAAGGPHYFPLDKLRRRS